MFVLRCREFCWIFDIINLSFRYFFSTIYFISETDESEQTVSIILNGIESELKLITEKNDKKVRIYFISKLRSSLKLFESRWDIILKVTPVKDVFFLFLRKPIFLFPPIYLFSERIWNRHNYFLVLLSNRDYKDDADELTNWDVFYIYLVICKRAYKKHCRRCGDDWRDNNLFWHTTKAHWAKSFYYHEV